MYHPVSSLISYLYFRNGMVTPTLMARGKWERSEVWKERESVLNQLAKIS
jgi:hypothetical protein